METTVNEARNEASWGKHPFDETSSPNRFTTPCVARTIGDVGPDQGASNRRAPESLNSNHPCHSMRKAPMFIQLGAQSGMLAQMWLSRRLGEEA